jgi:hypothetical protein
LYGYETWDLASDHRPRVFEDRVLGRIFGTTRDEIREGWRKLYEKFHNSYCSPNIIRMIILRKIRWAGDVAHKE